VRIDFENHRRWTCCGWGVKNKYEIIWILNKIVLSLHKLRYEIMKHSTVLGAFGILLIYDIILLWAGLMYGIPFLTKFSDKHGNALAICLGGLIMMVIIFLLFFIIFKFVNHNENINKV
jgi:hypothetical protein